LLFAIEAGDLLDLVKRLISSAATAYLFYQTPFKTASKILPLKSLENFFLKNRKKYLHFEKKCYILTKSVEGNNLNDRNE